MCQGRELLTWIPVPGACRLASNPRGGHVRFFGGSQLRQVGRCFFFSLCNDIWALCLRIHRSIYV